jgi:hypothetical protein
VAQRFDVFKAGTERVTFAASVSVDPSDPMVFRGMASAFGKPVDVFPPTTIERGAFTKTLRERGSKVVMLWSHDPSRPIGKPISLTETVDGLEVVFRLSDTRDAREVATLIRDGVVTGLSIGFDPISWRMTPPATPGEFATRILTEVRLMEVSVCAFPAQDAARLALSAVASLPNEAFEGRVLSNRNRRLMEDALAALQTILNAAAPEESEPPAPEPPDSDPVETHVAPPEVAPEPPAPQDAAPASDVAAGAQNAGATDVAPTDAQETPAGATEGATGNTGNERAALVESRLKEMYLAFGSFPLGAAPDSAHLPGTARN